MMTGKVAGRLSGRTRYWTEARISEAIATWSVAHHGKAPERFHFDNDDELPNSTTVLRTYGSLAAARQAAGLPPGAFGRGGSRRSIVPRPPSFQPAPHLRLGTGKHITRGHYGRSDPPYIAWLEERLTRLLSYREDIRAHYIAKNVQIARDIRRWQARLQEARARAAVQPHQERVP